MNDILERYGDFAQRLIDPDHQTYQTAWRELNTLPPEVANQLAWILGRDNPARIRMRMANVLATKAPELTHKLALMLLEEPLQGSLLAAFDHLIDAEDGSQTAVAQEHMLHHPDEYVRMKAACYLACFGDASHLESLRSRLGDEGQDEEGRTVGGECRDAIYNIELRLDEAGERRDGRRSVSSFTA